MAESPSVLVLDDGELDDVQKMLEGLEIPFGRVRGGAIAPGTPPPKDLLIATPRRINVVKINPDGGAAEPPMRMVIVNEDSNTLREHLRKVGFDYLVRRPVHPEALRLLLLHCLYRGEEKRGDPRVAVGFEVSFRAGLLNRKATLADLSVRGCRLLSHTRFEVGKRIKLQIPEALETGDPFSVAGRIIRVDFDPKAGEGGLYSAGVLFDRVSDTAREALEIIIEDRAQGPATLRRNQARRVGKEPDQPPTPGEDPSSRVDIEVDVRLEQDGEPGGTALSAKAGEERRQNRRGAYEQTVPAFGNRALRVLVGRDLSVGGMRIERLPGLEVGDRLHLAVYGDPGDAPFLIWGTVSRDDGERGMALVFDPVEPDVGHHLESLVGSLPAVESLHDSEVDAMGTVVSEILNS
ncbi:MAG TPA: PilZ domain-containing protein [Myxococcota bacterium]